MHVVIFVDFHDSAIGGVTTSVRGQRKGLEALGHTVTIVSPPPVNGSDSDPSVVTVPPVPHVRPNGFPLVAPTSQRQRFIEAELARRRPIDIIHVQTNMGLGILGVRIAKKHRVPLVQTMHGRDDVFIESMPWSLPLIVASKLFHQYHVAHTSHVPRLHDSLTAHYAWKVMVNHAQAADHVIMPSQHFEVKFREHGITKPISVISNGISDEVVATLPHDERQPSHGALKVMWCGRLSSEKRPLESVAAVAQIPGATLDMYGDGPLLGTVQAYLDEKGLNGRITLRGRVGQAEILSAMQNHDVLLYPSYGFDNQPMVLLEAVAAGLPVVYCDPDLTECMPTDGAFLADGIDVEAIVRALQSLTADPHRWQRMHRAMLRHRSKVAQSYHSKKMVQLYEQLIKS